MLADPAHACKFDDKVDVYFKSKYMHRLLIEGISPHPCIVYKHDKIDSNLLIFLQLTEHDNTA